jgi:hypothetical protein
MAAFVAVIFGCKASCTQSDLGGAEVDVADACTLKLVHTLVHAVQYESDPPEHGILYCPSGHRPVEHPRHALPKRNVFVVAQKSFV